MLSVFKLIGSVIPELKKRVEFNISVFNAQEDGLYPDLF